MVALSVDLLAWRVSHSALALRLIIVMKLDIGDSPPPPYQNDHDDHDDHDEKLKT